MHDAVDGAPSWRERDVLRVPRLHLRSADTTLTQLLTVVLTLILTLTLPLDLTLSLTLSLTLAFALTRSADTIDDAARSVHLEPEEP